MTYNQFIFFYYKFYLDIHLPGNDFLLQRVADFLFPSLFKQYFFALSWIYLDLFYPSRNKLLSFAMIWFSLKAMSWFCFDISLFSYDLDLLLTFFYNYLIFFGWELSFSSCVSYLSFDMNISRFHFVVTWFSLPLIWFSWAMVNFTL